MKVKTKSKYGQLTVEIKCPPGATENKQETDTMSRKLFRGFMKPSLIKRNVIVLTGPCGISLFDRLKRPISKYDFLVLIEQLISSVQKLQRNGMLWNKVIWNIRYAYVNEVTKELQLIYLPMNGLGNNASTVLNFLESILYFAKPMGGEDRTYVARLREEILQQKGFDPVAIENFIKREDRSIVSSIKRQVGDGSGFMTDKRQDYYKHYESIEDDERTGLLEEDDATGLLQEDDSTGLLQEDDATGLLQEDDATGLLQENTYGSIPNYEVEDNEESTGLLYESKGRFDEESTGLLKETRVVRNEEEPATCLFEDEDYYAADDDSGETSLLVESTVHYPTLFRVSNEETIYINKPVFRIGKERSYVDYFVSNNNAVSRSHADLIVRGDRCFVVDLNSKNRTYINGRMLPIHFETELFEGDRLRLGNEEFIFHA